VPYDDGMRFLAAFILLSACDAQTSTQSAPPPPAPPSSSALPSPIASPSSTVAAKPPAITFNDDPVGATSPTFEAVVGNWIVAEIEGARGLEVDGRKWRHGTPSTSLADQAKRLYGDHYAEFLDGVKAFAFFPLAIARDTPAGDVRISVRFYPIGGKVDQAAGIAFAIASDGSYLGVRANALEDNILFFKVVKGKRTILENLRDIPTPTKTWHTLAIELRGNHLDVFLDDQRRFERLLEATPTGRIGLWSKADSEVLFDDFTVTKL
jgi:hypothetical protein